ncbi:MAG: DUF3047 domain-containing protein [Candidatus Omnitrophica bacterium]|nr:DUF3047 domain-containing protein [Candidatus Omnitrophota bacterium]
MRKILIILAVTVALTAVVTSIERLYEPRRIAPAIKRVIEKIIRSFSFEREDALREWEEKILKGRTVYTRETGGTHGAYIKASSKNGCSMLYYKITVDPRKHPVIKWKWMATDFPVKKLPECISCKKEEDYAGRVYVAFPASFFINSKAIEYIWTKDLPAGTRGESPYSKNIKILVLRSGDPKGEWMSEERDVYADYVSLFGKEPKYNIGGIAFMTNADNTRTEAACLYDEIKLTYPMQKEPHAN